MENVINSFNFQLKDVIFKLHEESISGDFRDLEEACETATNIVSATTQNDNYQFREEYFHPLKIAFASQSIVLVKLAIEGFQIIFNNDLLWTNEDTSKNVALELLTQFLHAISKTPSHSDENNFKITKILEHLVKTHSYAIPGSHVLKIAELCVEIFEKTNDSITRCTCQAILLQLLGSICKAFGENIEVEKTHGDVGQDNNNPLQSTFIGLFKQLCERINAQYGDLRHRQNDTVLTLCLESVQYLLENVPENLQKDSDFVYIVWKILCPALIQLLSSLDDVKTKGLWSNNNGNNPNVVATTVVSTIKSSGPQFVQNVYAISGELIRLVGNMELLRPILDSLFRKILCFSHDQNSLEVLKIVKEILGNPERLFYVAGPTNSDGCTSLESITEKNKTGLDLFLTIMDSIQKIREQSDQTSLRSASVSCVVTLLATLEELSHGRGLNECKYNDILNSVSESDYDNDIDLSLEEHGENSTLSPKCTNLDANDGDVDGNTEAKKTKRIRWLMDYEESTHSDEEDSVILPKTVSWAEHHEERFIERRATIPCQHQPPQDLLNFPAQKPKHYTSVKSRTDSGLKNNNNNKIKREKNPFKTDGGLIRSQSVLDLQLRFDDTSSTSAQFLLRRSNSTSVLEVKDRQRLDINVIKTSLTPSSDNKGKMNHRINLKNERHTSPSDTGKIPKPILRKARTAAVTAGTVEESTQVPSHGVTTETGQTDQNVSHRVYVENTSSPSKETTINGIPLSKLPRQKQRRLRNGRERIGKMKTKNKTTGVTSAATATSTMAESPKKPMITGPEISEKTVEECEREGARNFARCLLGILPSVLAATEPWTADELLQQFSSDVCEAVTCLALKRKNVPDFGTVRRLHVKRDQEENNYGVVDDPTLNADGVYKAVYETLKLNYELNTSGYYKKPGSVPHISQNEFVDSITSFEFPVHISDIWIGEVYRLVTTYDILSKAGFKNTPNETTSVLIETLSGKLYSQRLPHLNEEIQVKDGTQAAASLETKKKKAGKMFAKRLLIATWDRISNTLVLPLTGINEPLDQSKRSTQVENMIANDPSKDFAVERLPQRDLVCLTLDGLRRAARLCCHLEIQSGCDVVLSRLAQASFSFFKDERTVQSSNELMLSVQLHVAHVLSMDALLAVGLELALYSPKAWSYVFEGCMNISTLEQASFTNSATTPTTTPSTHRLPTLPLSLKSNTSMGFYANSNTSSDSFSPDSTNSFSPVAENQSNNTSLTACGFLPAEDACRAVYALSNAMDNLFDMAASALPLNSLKEFMVALVDASTKEIAMKESSVDATQTTQGIVRDEILSMNTLHLYHICDVMLRCARNNTRPLLHVMEVWSVVSSHLIEATLSKDRSVSKVAITSIHDVIGELLKRRNELPHFWFYSEMLKPLDSLVNFDVLDDELHGQILYTLYELVRGFGPSIKSGWRTIFECLSSIYTWAPCNKLVGVEDRTKMVCSIVEHFVQLKTTNVFAGGVVSCVLCLLKFVRTSPQHPSDESFDTCESSHHEHSYDEISNHSNMDDSSGDANHVDGLERNDSHQSLCPASLKMLWQISKRLSNIYIQPSCVIFHGSYDVLLVNMSESQHKLWDDAWSSNSTINNTGNKSNDVEQNKGRNGATTATSIIAIDDTGILRIWFLMLEGLSSCVTKCQQHHLPNIIELLFDILQSLTTIPGPHFSMFVMSNLVLPMLKSWLTYGSDKKRYWETTFNDFKHACGLATQLIAEEMENFLQVEGASDCVPVMLKQLLDLFHDCIIQPHEAIARLGCSCLRHLLLSAGPQFTEDLWHILCKGVKLIIDSTLFQLRQLLACFEMTSTSVTGDNGTVVKIVARRDVTPTETLRSLQLAEQVFLLESQVYEGPLRMDESELDDDDVRSYVFLIIPNNNDPNESPKNIRVPFRSLMVALLANQILIQMLGSVLLESVDSVHGPIISTITDAGLLKRNNKDSSLPGLLNHLSQNNLNVLFDCLLDTHNAAHEFNMRPGLRCLTQKLARLDTRANLFRTSITSFAFYLNTLFQISKYDGEHFSISNIKRILTGEKVLLDPMSPESPTKMATKLIGKIDMSLTNSEEIDWIIRRLHEACNQITKMYQKLHQLHLFKEQDSGFSDTLSDTSSPCDGSPQRQLADVSEESIYMTKLLKGAHIATHAAATTTTTTTVTRKSYSPFRSKKNAEEAERNSLETMKRKEDEILHLSTWSQLIISMLDLLLALPILQFKSVLPAVFPAVTSLITTVYDPKVRQLVCDVIRRCGTIYGIN